jgi:hypothetical protein
MLPQATSTGMAAAQANRDQGFNRSMTDLLQWLGCKSALRGGVQALGQVRMRCGPQRSASVGCARYCS